MVFGSYLISKNILSKRQVVEALAYQLSKQPSLFQIAANNNILSDDKLLYIFKNINEGKDFLETVRKFGYLNQKQISSLIQTQMSGKIPFGHVLVTLGILKFDEVQKHILDFLNLECDLSLEKLNQSDKELVESEPNIIPANEIGHLDLNKKETIEELDGIVVPVFEFYALEESLIEEFSCLLDENKKIEIEKEIINWTKGVSKEQLRTFYRELHTLKGTARFLKTFGIEFIIHNMENLLGDMTRVVDLLSEKELSKLEEVFLSGLDMIWDVRTTVIQFQSEEEFWINGGYEKVRALLIRIASMQSVCNEADDSSSLVGFTDQF